MVPLDRDPCGYVIVAEELKTEILFESGSYISRSERDAVFDFPRPHGRPDDIERKTVMAFHQDQDQLDRYGHAVLVIAGRRIGTLNSLVQALRSRLRRGDLE